MKPPSTPPPSIPLEFKTKGLILRRFTCGELNLNLFNLEKKDKKASMTNLPKKAPSLPSSPPPLPPNPFKTGIPKAQTPTSSLLISEQNGYLTAVEPVDFKKLIYVVPQRKPPPPPIEPDSQKPPIKSRELKNTLSPPSSLPPPPPPPRVIPRTLSLDKKSPSEDNNENKSVKKSLFLMDIEKFNLKCLKPVDKSMKAHSQEEPNDFNKFINNLRDLISELIEEFN